MAKAMCTWRCHFIRWRKLGKEPVRGHDRILFYVHLLFLPLRHKLFMGSICLLYLTSVFPKVLNITNVKPMLYSIHCLCSVAPLYLGFYIHGFNHGWKKRYIVADMYDVVRPVITVSILNMYGLFFSLLPKQYSIAIIYTALTLY